jgi:hypothetical protein
VNWLRRIFHLPLDGEVISRSDRPLDCFGVQQASESLAERQRAAREAMGVRWIGHPDARPSRERLDQLHAQALVEDAERALRWNVRRFRR